MKDRFFFRAVVVAVWLVGNAAGLAGERPSVTPPSQESDAERSARHLRIAERRAGTMVIVHRGASAFAPENSLAAYAAAMDYGADGCEVDLRRTRDGVLVLFHDETLDHLTCGFGAVNQLTYDELVALRPQRQSGRALYSGAPTFAALLELARQRAMLLHLDVKEPGLEDDIARQFDDADAWDHVVSINTYNTARLRTHPKLKLLAHKGPGLSEFRRDMDPDAVQAQLARPGEMIMVDNPRVAVRALKRDPYQPMPLPRIAAFDEKLTQYKQRVPALFRFNALLTSVPSQRLVTDCEVCCRPFQVHAECEPGEILSLEVASS